MTKAEAALKQLASVSQTLNQASDELSQHLTEVESALNAYKLGVSAWVELRKETEPYEPDNDGRRYELTYVELLGYGKYKSKWGLLVAAYCEETFEGEYDQEYFLREAPRETRLAAVEKLPDLIARIAEEAAKVKEEATEKAVQAKQIAAALSRKNR